jgi:hypothetical protein
MWLKILNFVRLFDALLSSKPDSFADPLTNRRSNVLLLSGFHKLIWPPELSYCSHTYIGYTPIEKVCKRDMEMLGACSCNLQH